MTRKIFTFLMIISFLNGCQGLNFGIWPQKPFNTPHQSSLYSTCRVEIYGDQMDKPFYVLWQKWDTRREYCIMRAKEACNLVIKIDERVVETCNYWRTKYNLFPNYKPPTQEELDKYNLFK